jgi:hypothetical protein
MHYKHLNTRKTLMPCRFQSLEALVAVTVVLAMATAAAAQLQVVQQQMNQAVMEPDIDFGAQLAEEIVDINSAHSSTEDAEAKDMQSLLNWAIGGKHPLLCHSDIAIWVCCLLKLEDASCHNVYEQAALLHKTCCAHVSPAAHLL